MGYQIVINEYTGGLTGHVNVTFIANGSSAGTFGQNLAANEGVSGGFLAGGTYPESNNGAIQSIINVTPAQYAAALNYALGQVSITNNGQGSYNLVTNNCVTFAQSVLDASGLPGAQSNLSSYLKAPAAVQADAAMLDFLRSTGAINASLVDLSFDGTEVTGTPDGSSDQTITITNGTYSSGETYFNFQIAASSGQNAQSGTLNSDGSFQNASLNLSNANIGVDSQATVTVNGSGNSINLSPDDDLTASYSYITLVAAGAVTINGAGNQIYSAANTAAMIYGAQNTDIVNGYNAQVSAEDCTIIIDPTALLSEISAENDALDDAPPPQNLPIGGGTETDVTGSGNTFAIGSNTTVNMSGNNNTADVTGSNSTENISGSGSKVIIGAYTDQNTISTTVGESISAGVDAKFAVLASGVTIAADGDDIYVDGTNDTIVDPYGRVEFASPSDVADYGDRVSGVDSSYGFGEGYGYGQYGEYGGYGFDKAPTSTGSNIGSIAAFDADSQNGRGAGAAETARLQAESSLSGSTSNAAPQFEGSKWSSKIITWSLASGSDTVGVPLSGVIGSQYVSLIEAAFQTWGAASGLQFQEVSDSSSSDIRIGWNTFGASSGVLGYTGFNASLGVIGPGATISLEDPSEIALTTDANGQLAYSGTQTELEQLLLHEIGHALGLADDSDPDSIMNAVLGASNRTLDATDIAGIQTLYEQTTFASETASAAADVTTGLSDITSLASHSPITVASSLISNLTSSALTPFSTEADQLILAMAAFQPTASPTTFTPVTATSVASAMTLAAAGI